MVEAKAWLYKAHTPDGVKSVLVFHRATHYNGYRVTDEIPLVPAEALAERDALIAMKQRDFQEIASAAVLAACESEPAAPDHPDTILITTGDFEAIVHSAVENWWDRKALKEKTDDAC